MGCDIHLYVERKTENGWELVCWEPENPDPADRGANYAVWFSDRNYALFSWLAGVRGSRDSSRFPRLGIPKDASPGLESEYESWIGDAHSASYISYKEIAAALEEMYPESGYIREDDYIEWKSKHLQMPYDWHSYLATDFFTEEEYLSKDNDKKKTMLSEEIYIKCDWQMPIKDRFASFARLIKNIKNDVGEDSRIVFWFDN